jgi:hypothetical protein
MPFDPSNDSSLPVSHMTCRFFTAPASALAWLLLASLVAAQPPAITHVVPAGIPPGAATDITLFGANLAGVTGFWTSLPAKVELTPGIANNGKEAGKVTYRITLPKEAQAGIGALRVATDKGVSNIRLLLIDDLPVIADNGGNKSLATAQELKLPTAVDGACEAESYDFYKFTAKAGQRVAVDVYAKRLGSALDPVLRLLDAAGRVIATSDDEGGIGADCRVAFTSKSDGVYFIELRDITYQGSATHRYRLRVGDLPLVNSSFPMAVKKGATASVQFAGPSVGAAAATPVNMPPNAPIALAIAAKAASGQGASPVTVLASDLNEVIEKEPNDGLPQSTAVTLPAGLSGRFEQPKDVDYYRFEAKKGQRFIFQGQTRSLGSPTTLFLRVANAQGAAMVEADDPITAETSLDFTAPADGVYHLLVREWQGFSGPEHAYRIEARAFEPGFSLSVDSEQLNAPRGGVAVVKATAVRRGYAGPITLELTGLPQGCQIADATIGENKNDTIVRITVPANLSPGGMFPLTVVGKAKIGDKQFSAQADTLPALRKAVPGLEYPPRYLTGNLALGVGQPFPEFFQLAVAPIEFPQLFGQVTFNVTAKRLNNFPDAITLAVEGLPKGFQAKVVPIPQGQAQAAVTLTGPAELPEGEHKITLRGSGTFQNQPKTVALPAVVLKVVKPLGIALAAPVTIAAGAKQKVKIVATRRGGEQGEIAVEFKDLPAGVTAPAGIKIPQGKSDVEVELSAAANAAPTKAANAAVLAKAKIKGKDVSVESPPTVVEVKKPEEKKADAKKAEAKKADAKKPEEKKTEAKKK